MIVTTSYAPSAEAKARAAALASELQSRYAPRGAASVRKLSAAYADTQVMVVTERDIQYYNGDQAPLFFHPSLSLIRYKRMMDGQPDTLMQLSGAQPGDRVLDCTAGLATDAIVFAIAVGEQGQVTAIESASALHMVVREGLREYETFSPSFNAAMRRVNMKLGNHLGVLRGMADRSVDIVYFDPMFRQPVEESSSIGPLRGISNPNPLALESIREALRVARKSVVLKEHRDSGEFERLGFDLPPRTRTKITYGVIHP
ncbi:MAG: SAM-dependent methyltransferase [Paenibacillus sp.]|jgi:hypothetical protein|nr:SAM-dependent methyltransferase [Paenibacillus sp.]